jgi:L-threonylcarbamoyladenylate synthase
MQLTPETARAAVEAAIRTLRAGGIAFLPAEGVYGLHARADLPAAMSKLRGLKPRVQGKGTIALLSAPSELETWCGPVGPEAHALVAAHWPGALTLVLPALPRVPEALVAPDGTVALRCPGSDFLRAVVAGAGGLVASTSANAAGQAPAVNAAGAIADRADLVVDAGPLAGTPSTVAAVEHGVVRILREGAVRVTPGRP